MKGKSLPGFPILTTERLILRPLLESDVEEIFLLRSDPEINKYLDRKPCEPREAALYFIKNIKENELLYWAITQKNTGKLIGTVCLYGITGEFNKCGIGYAL